MKLSKETKEKLMAFLGYPLGHVRLKCDGFVIDFQVEPYKSLSYRVMTYVNGSFKGIWISSKNVHPEQKFLRKLVKRLYSPKEIQTWEKIYGKRAVAKDPRYKATMTSYWADFPNGKAAIAHVCRVSETIEILIPEDVTP